AAPACPRQQLDIRAVASCRGHAGAADHGPGLGPATGEPLPYGTGAAETVDSVASAGPIGPGGIVGCDGSVRPGFAPRWSGLERGSGPDVADLIAETIELSGAPHFPNEPDQASLIPIGV